MRGRLAARDELTAAETGAMRRLLARHFRGVDEEGFEADLAEKDWVILLEDGGLVGFSTFRLDRERFDGRDLTVVCSGDTIVEPTAWGTPVLPRTWIRSVRRLQDRHGGGELWWLLIVSGFRTYRFLPVFCRVFHAGPSLGRRPGRPSGGREGPGGDRLGDRPGDRRGGDRPAGDRLATMAAHLAARRFGARYDARTGIVRLPRPQRLREPLLDIPAGRLSDPGVRRFLRLNPGHADGDELVCLASLDDANLTRAGRRMLDGGPADPCGGSLPRRPGARGAG